MAIRETHPVVARATGCIVILIYCYIYNDSTIMAYQSLFASNRLGSQDCLIRGWINL